MYFAPRTLVIIEQGVWKWQKKQQYSFPHTNVASVSEKPSKILGGALEGDICQHNNACMVSQYLYIKHRPAQLNIVNRAFVERFLVDGTTPKLECCILRTRSKYSKVYRWPVPTPRRGEQSWRENQLVDAHPTAESIKRLIGRRMNASHRIVHIVLMVWSSARYRATVSTIRTKPETLVGLKHG